MKVFAKKDPKVAEKMNILRRKADFPQRPEFVHGQNLRNEKKSVCLASENENQNQKITKNAKKALKNSKKILKTPEKIPKTTKKNHFSACFFPFLCRKLIFPGDEMVSERLRKCDYGVIR